MATKRMWDITFVDGRTVSVEVSSKRMARAKGSVVARRHPNEIVRVQKRRTRGYYALYISSRFRS